MTACPIYMLSCAMVRLGKHLGPEVALQLIERQVCMLSI